jgi:hypothetical protein
MPRSFSEDGAAGASGGNPSLGLNNGSMTDTPPSTVTSPNVSSGLSKTTTSLGGAVPTLRGGAGVQSGMADPSSFSAFDWATMNGTNPNAPVMSDPMSLYFDQGGAVPEDVDSSGGSDGSDPSSQSASEGSNGLIAQALAAVQDTLKFTRDQYGITGDQQGGDQQGGGQQVAGMATVPGSQSNSGIPPLQPAPGPLPPTSNPFGQRTTPPRPMQTAGMMPAIPGNQSESGVAPLQPAPGPLPPTSNPFGQRTTPPRPMQMGAIPDDDDQEAA